MTRPRHHRGAVAIALAALTAVTVAAPTTASGEPGDTGGFTATPLSPTSRVTGAKSVTGTLAETDPSLLGRRDSTLVNVVVKLDYDATASYAGGIDGLAATSPAVTGRALTGRSPAEVTYERYTGNIDATFRNDLRNAVPKARAKGSLRRVYGGVVVTLPANQVGKVLDLPNVAAVQVDELRTIQTDSSNDFIGSPTIWAQNGGQALAGQGTIFGDLDTGVWPEHPSFADQPALGSPPPKADGTPRTCDYGDNPLTPATDVFVCNRKLIGGQPFLDTYNSVVGGEVYPDSARDSDGHGTHTTSTAAGNMVSSAPIFGVERGPISGVAPGAWVIGYKVCGIEGCYSSDSAAAVEQAILDGVDVINFSIGGGSTPYSDVAELAFLDAYDAGILVAASAGNSGPGAGTTDHVSPWTITVAASTQTREFQSTLTLTDGAQSAQFVGASITAAVGTATPIVLAENIPGYDSRCSTELPAGAATGKVVACRRGVIGRVQKGYNVLQGGAVGMVLYNLPLQDIETDNHFLPTVHLADGTAFLAFMAAHPAATASFTAGVKGTGQGDVMAAFSSRGPGGQFLKPDITAPGVQILAGHSPTPDQISAGPAGEYFQAIAGTSMSAPHIAGSALLLRSLHPNWTPGAIKSALMTTAAQDVVKEDGVTPTDPFDDGAGRVDLTVAGAAKLVIDESAVDMFFLGSDPITALDVNTPSVNVPTMPGTVTLSRTVTNVSDRTVEFKVSTTTPSSSTIEVRPKSGRVRPGASLTFRITITSSAPVGQYFGEIRLTSKQQPTMHLPVAFFNQQGAVTLAQSCDPTTIREGSSTICNVSATNQSFADAAVSMSTTVSNGLKITSATGATVNTNRTTASAGPVVLAGKQDATPSIAPATDTPVGGYLPLELFGITPIAVGDETNLNFDVPGFTFGGKTYTRVGVVSNGYLLLGGSDSGADIQFAPQTLPDPARPNGVLAPYWTDLDGTGAPGIRAATLTDGIDTWLVIQWNLRLWGQPAAVRNMQAWIRLGTVEDVSFEYSAPDTLGVGTPPGYGLTVGAENDSGTGGAQISGPPIASYRVTTTPGAPGETVSYTLTVRGQDRGTRTVTSNLLSDIVAGTTTVRTPIVVTR